MNRVQLIDEKEVLNQAIEKMEDRIQEVKAIIFGKKLTLLDLQDLVYDKQEELKKLDDRLDDLEYARMKYEDDLFELNELF